MDQKFEIDDKQSNATYDHVLKYTGVFGGVQGVKILIKVLQNKLASLFLGPAGLGLSAIYSNLAEVFNNTTNLGLPFSGVRQVSEIFEEGSSTEMEGFIKILRSWALCTGIVAAILCIALTPLFTDLSFSTSKQSVDIILLGILVLCLPIEACECSILKGLRKLKRLALVEASCALATFLTTIPYYYFWHIHGVVIALTCSNLATMFVHLHFSTQLYPWRVKIFSLSTFKKGFPLAKLGVPYAMFTLVNTVVCTLVYNFLHEDTEVGFYKAGYGLMVTYAGMVFVAVEADYFPRLSSVNHNLKKLNATINQQIEVCVLLMTPLLVGFILIMPWVIRILYTEEFLVVVPMTVSAVYYMFFKAITTPIGYTSLAKGDSVVFLVMELIYDVFFLTIMYFGYKFWGLVGTGIGLSASSLFDLILISSVYKYLYGFKIFKRTMKLILPEFLCLSAVLPFCYFGGHTFQKFSVGIIALLISLFLAYKLLSKESGYLGKIISKFKHNSGCNC